MGNRIFNDSPLCNNSKLSYSQIKQVFTSLTSRKEPYSSFAPWQFSGREVNTFRKVRCCFMEANAVHKRQMSEVYAYKITAATALAVLAVTQPSNLARSINIGRFACFIKLSFWKTKARECERCFAITSQECFYTHCVHILRPWRVEKLRITAAIPACGVSR